MNGCFLGIDTSNYTTSVAAVKDGKLLFNLKAPLPVKEGECGLRQSDALFAHVKNFPELFSKVRELLSDQTVLAVGVSEKPRNVSGSYMPCFLAGVSVAEGISASLNVPLYHFSHQCGHLRAALFSAGQDALRSTQFGAFHVSGGTTEMLLVHPDENGFRTEIVGGTRDLNAGQLIDRVGVMLGLSFPAGPALEALASTFTGKRQKASLKSVDGYVHISGAENQARRLYESEENAAKTAAFVLDYIATALVSMSLDYREKYETPLVYAGGVMSNAYIRGVIAQKIKDVYFAEPALSADNAVGIACLAKDRFERTF